MEALGSFHPTWWWKIVLFMECVWWKLLVEVPTSTNSGIFHVLPWKLFFASIGSVLYGSKVSPVKENTATNSVTFHVLLRT